MSLAKYDIDLARKQQSCLPKEVFETKKALEILKADTNQPMEMNMPSLEADKAVNYALKATANMQLTPADSRDSEINKDAEVDVSVVSTTKNAERTRLEKLYTSVLGGDPANHTDAELRDWEKSYNQQKSAKRLMSRLDTLLKLAVVFGAGYVAYKYFL